jgi:hypothetical protein
MKTYNHYVKGIDPVADAFAGTVYSDVISMKNNNHITFIYYKGVSTGGTDNVTITVEACSTNAAAATSAIPFKYRAVLTGDTHSDLTAVAATGLLTTVGSSQVYAIEVDAEALASSGYEYIRLKAVEDANDPTVGCVLAILSEPKYDSAVQATAIV